MRRAVSAFIMSIDYSFADRPRGWPTFDFIPCDHNFLDHSSNDSVDHALFNIREEAFLFIEGLVADSIPDWSRAYRHWGITWIGRDTWLDILARFNELRRDIRGNVPLKTIISKYVLYSRLMPREQKLHRKALLKFLDRFEERVRSVIHCHPYLLIGGI